MTEAMAPGQGDVEFQRRLYTDPNPTRRGLHSRRRDWVLGEAMAASAPGDRVLEVGVGCGVFTEALAAAGRKVSAVDINPAFLANVAGIDAVATHLKDATLPLDLGEHDVAICSEVLEHVPPERSQAMLDTLFGALRPGGTWSSPPRSATPASNWSRACSSSGRSSLSPASSMAAPTSSATSTFSPPANWPRRSKKPASSRKRLTASVSICRSLPNSAAGPVPAPCAPPKPRSAPCR